MHTDLELHFKKCETFLKQKLKLLSLNKQQSNSIQIGIFNPNPGGGEVIPPPPPLLVGFL